MAESEANGHRRSTRTKRAKSEAPTTNFEVYDTLRRELEERLVALRAEFREAIVNYSIQVQGVMSQLGEDLAAESPGLPAGELKARIRSLRDALEDLDDLDLKPTKGRRRDLKRIEEYVVHLSHLVGEW